MASANVYPMQSSNLVVNFDEHRKACVSRDQRRNIRIDKARDEIIFPVAGNGAILDFRRSLPCSDIPSMIRPVRSGCLRGGGSGGQSPMNIRNNCTINRLSET